MKKYYFLVSIILLLLVLSSCATNDEVGGSNGVVLPNATYVHIYEGYRIEGIINTFVKNGIGTRDGFVDAISNVDYSADYWFVAELNQTVSQQDQARTYHLEGYLAPGTYAITDDMNEEAVVRLMLDQFDKNYDQSIKDKAAELGYTTDQVVCLASIVERESSPDEYDIVSSVFHNRLDIDMKLQSNVTVMYTMTDEDKQAPMTIDLINKYDNAYNTYLYKGLPLGPICSPSKAAIEATLNPANTEYLFFVADVNGKTYYSKTYEEHKENVAYARSIEKEDD